MQYQLSEEQRARLDKALESTTEVREIRFRKLTGKLYINKQQKVLAVGTFASGHLEPGDGYIIVAGSKILLSAAQIAELERGS